jgi:cytochrome P450
MPDLSELFLRDADDPYPLYATLRAQPVQWDEGLNSWLLPRYAEAARALRDERLTYPVPTPDPLPAPLEGLEEQLHVLYGFRRLVIIHRQGSAHERLRREIQPHFTPSALAAMRPRIQYLADSLLDRVLAEGRMDVMDDLASPLATTTMGLLLGLPLEDMERFAGWCTDVLYGWPDSVYAEDPRESVHHAYESLRELWIYLLSLAHVRRLAPTGDLISTLAAAWQRGALSAGELVANVAFICESGRSTTSHLIGNSVLALLCHPDQVARLRQDPALIALAVDEFMRYDTPGLTVARIACEDLLIEGTEIRRGQQVMPLLCAANRDPARFPDADRLNVGRRQGPHLGFGAGDHYCPGAPLGRLADSLAVQAVLHRLSGLRQGPKAPTWRAHPIFRLLKSLPITWERT